MTLRRWMAMIVAFVVAMAGSAGPAHAQAAGVYFNMADNTTVTDPVLNVSVMVCAPTQLIYFTAQHLYSGGSTVLGPSGGSGWMSCDGGQQAQPYDVSMYLVSGVNQLWIDAGDGLSFEQSVGLTITLVDPEPDVNVETSATGSQMTTGATVQRHFTIHNPKSTSRTFSLNVSCSGVVTCTGMSQPGSATVAPGAAIDVFVLYSVSGGIAGTGTLTLTATDNSSNTNTDFAAANVQIIPRPAIATRSLCLSISAGPGASVECGSLRLAHSLPGVRTYSTTRAPVLTYESQQASPMPIFSLAAALPLGQPPPTIVVTTVTINGTSVADTTPGSEYPAAQDRRAMVAVNAGNWPTAVYGYSVEVRRFWSGTSAVMASSNGSIAIVNRSQSPFGAGWWIAGVEQIVSLSNVQKLWIGGDGSTKVYERVAVVGSDSVFMATRQSYSDTLRYVHTQTGWLRRLPTGGYVKFNAQLQHVATVNRLAQTTSFSYDPTTQRLSQISVPPASAGLAYGFSYNGSGKLASITVPDSVSGTYRTVLTTVDGSGRLTEVRDPGITTPIVFGYDVSANKLVVSRTDRRNGVVRFAYDAAQRVSQARQKLTASDSAVVSFCVGETMGLSDCQSTVVAPADVRTIVDGARDTVPDLITFWIDGLGQPTKIVNALGDSTTIARGDARYPALVTRMREADGRVARASYDERGQLAISVDTNDVVSGTVPRVTRYEWHDKWNMPTVVVSPAGQFMRMDYDAISGNLLWEEDRRGFASRTTYQYDANGLMLYAQKPGGARDSLYYDSSRWNVSGQRSASGKRIVYETDILGRLKVTKTLIATDTTQNDTLSYDALSRVIRQVSSGPAINGVSAQRVIVVNTYDAESNQESLVRTISPTVNGLSSFTTSWGYDLAGRRVVEVSPDNRRDSTVYSRAGLAIRQVTKRGDTLYTQYDALGRVVKQIDRAASDISAFRAGASWLDSTEAWNPAYGGYEHTRDTTDFEYDKPGRLTRATNRDARVRRTYDAFGAIGTDSLWIKSWVRDTVNAYGIRYDYDLNGRVTNLWYPSQLVQGSQMRATYQYDLTSGLLSRVTGLQNEEFNFTYNDRNELTQLAMPGSITETNEYSVDGQMTLHRIHNGTPANMQDRYPATWIDSTRAVYDLRGRTRYAVNRFGAKDSTAARYSGLGHVVTNAYNATGMDAYGKSLTAIIGETFSYDALGDLLVSGSGFCTIVQGGGGLVGTGPATNCGQTVTRTNRYDAVSGRLLADSIQGIVTSFTYDAAGNAVLSSTSTHTGGSTYQRYDDRMTTYNSAGRIVMSERRFNETDQLGYSNPSTRIWRIVEHYRYDPLGRRVLVRAVMTCNFPAPQQVPSGCDVGTTRRTVWAGANELVEIQRPVADVDSFTTAQMESDTSPLILSVRPSGLYETSIDRNWFYGRVAYTHGLAVDRPLSLTQFAHVSRRRTAPSEAAYAWPAFTLVPHWNMRGEAVTGTFASGAAFMRTTVSGNVRFVGVQWSIGGLAYGRLVVDSLGAWHGTLLTDKRDMVGTYYRRNRSYDPAIGRFTQEDPIGIAGGLNLYGYANGDPINYSDPFGLAVCFKGSAEDVQKLKAGSEDATNTTITLDKKNCVSKAEANEGDGFAEIQERFNGLVADDDVFTVRYGAKGEGFYSHFDPRTKSAIILRGDVGGFRYRTGNWLSCNLIGGNSSAPMTLGGLVAHELIGHGRGAGEMNSRRIENQYHIARGQPARCLGG